MRTLSQKIAATLDARTDKEPLPCRVAVESDGQGLALELTACSALGVAFDALEFTDPNDGARSAEALRGWADRLAARVTYLMEPLVLIELDAVAGEVELRSQAPTARGEMKSFYEVRLNKQGTMRLTRMVFDEETRRRRPAGCQLTREVLERLTDDLVGCSG